MTKGTEPLPIPISDDSQRQSSVMYQQRQRSSSTTTEPINKHIRYNDDNAYNNTSRKEDKILAADSPQTSTSIKDYDFRGIIGYGSSATVYHAVYLAQNLRVAIKMIDLDMFERNQIDELRRETALMALSKHENVLTVYNSFVSGSKLYIVTPFLAGGSCLDIIKTAYPEGLDELSIVTILKQALEGMAYLHKNGHIHRDIKAGNLLVDADGTVLLADFGVSSSLMDTGERGLRRTFVGTPCWMAPEVMQQEGYDYKADIWSFGITAIELAHGKAPYAKLSPLKVLMMTLSQDPPTLSRETSRQRYSKTFKDMIDLCLNKEPAHRPTAEKLLLHPFFKQARKKDYLVKGILSDLPPLERRRRKNIHRRQLSFTTSDEWDFNSDDYDDDRNGDGGEVDVDGDVNGGDGGCLKDSSQQKQQLSKLDHRSTLAATGTVATSFQQQDLSSKEAVSSFNKPKRHISFGDVVVRNPPQPSVLIPSSKPTCSTSSATLQQSHHFPEETISPSILYTDTERGSKKATVNDGIGGCESMEFNRPKTDQLTNDSVVVDSGLPQSCRLAKSGSSESTGGGQSRFKIQHHHEPLVPGSSVIGTQTFPLLYDQTLLPPSSLPISRTSSSLPTSSCSQTYQWPSDHHLYLTPRAQYHQDHSSLGSGKELSGPTTDELKKVSSLELATAAIATATGTVMDTGPACTEYHPVPTPSPLSSFDTPLLHNYVSFNTVDQHQYQQQQVHPSPTSVASSGPHLSASGLNTSRPVAAIPSTLQLYIEKMIRYNDAQRHLIDHIFSSYQTEPHLQKQPFSPSPGEDMTILIKSLERQLCRVGKENANLRMENGQLRKELQHLKPV